jgi:ribose-phosphate pyrophosphokinase
VKFNPGSPWTPIEHSHYPDSLPLVNFSGGLPVSVCLRPRTVDSFMCGLWFVDALLERGIREPELVLPLVPGSRQDRLNTTGDYLFTLKSVAKEINMRKFRKVTTWDPHSDACHLIDRLEVLHVDQLMIQSGAFATRKWDAVIAPDAGSAKRAARVAKLFKIPLYQAWKTRNPVTGTLTGLGIEDMPEDDAICLVVDDLCDAGGTFIGLADMLLEQDVYLDLWVTHGLFTKGTETLLSRYNHIYTTNSTLNNKSGIEVINLI